MVLLLSSVGMASAKGKDGGSEAKGSGKSTPSEEPTAAPTTSGTSTGDDGDTSGSTSSGSTAPKRTRSAESGTVKTSGSGSSAATITLSGCVVSSSKDISNIAFYDGSRLLAKDESVGATTFDLRSFGRIGEVDRIVVKSGTTSKGFTVDCSGSGGSGAGGSGGDDDENGGTGGSGTADDDKVTDGKARTSGENSSAIITVSGCVVTSTKDISNIAFSDGARFLDKDESINSTSFDLRGYDGIDEVTRIVVKSGTTSRTFSVNCATGDGAGGDDAAKGDDGGKDDTGGDDDTGDTEKDDTGTGANGETCPVDMRDVADMVERAHVSAVGAVAVGTFTVPVACAAVPVSLAVYQAGSSAPWRSTSGVFGPGAHALALAVPDCAFVATLSVGAPALNGPRVLDRTSGGDAPCATGTGTGTGDDKDGDDAAGGNNGGAGANDDDTGDDDTEGVGGRQDGDVPVKATGAAPGASAPGQGQPGEGEEGAMPLPGLGPVEDLLDRDGTAPGQLPAAGGPVGTPEDAGSASAAAGGAPGEAGEEGVEGAAAAPGAPAPSGSLPYTGARSLGLIGLLTMLGAVAMRAIGKRAAA